MDCPNCNHLIFEVYETDGDGINNDYIEYVVCDVCETEYSIEYKCKILKVTKTN